MDNDERSDKDVRRGDDARPSGRRWHALAAAACLGLLLALVGVYVTEGPLGNGQGQERGLVEAGRTAAALKPLAQGEVAAFVAHDAPRAAADIAFVDGDGATRKLADWRGRTVLINLWATWCAPCRHEMPALDALQRELGGDDFEVVAINLDRGGPEKGEAFYAEIGLRSLGYYHDPSGRIFRELQAFGMPTTLLIGAGGHEIGRLAGPAEWHSDDALALIRAALDFER